MDAGSRPIGVDATSPTTAQGTPSTAQQPPPPTAICASDVSAASCAFPSSTAPRCADKAPPIQIVYPSGGILVPPNLNVLSVQWTPYGGPFQRFSVDFSNPPSVDWHIITTCADPTVDALSGEPSGGCEVTVDPVSWAQLTAMNRGGSVLISVRGTTDGTCVSAPSNSVRVSFADEDLAGTYYYWKSAATPTGMGGQIWGKTFGDLNQPESDVTSVAFPGTTCNGCHALSRDGSRMIVYSDDVDSDDEYGDTLGSLLTGKTDLVPVTPLALSLRLSFGVAATGQPPGFVALHPGASYYLASNGVPLMNAGLDGGAAMSSAYPATVPSNGFSLWNAQSGGFVAGVTAGSPGTRPTMPDWSSDGRSVVYVQPTAVAHWTDATGAVRSDDDHIFGGSLYTLPYLCNGEFGTPAVLLQSGGENNYYPNYSPDGTQASAPSFVLFNRAVSNTDSFWNPYARVMVLANRASTTPIDLETANGSPLAAPVPLSNSYPRWAPFVQTYGGSKILWFTFSSTRDYGRRVLNHKATMRPCFPPGSYEAPDAALGQSLDTRCQTPQLWMAAFFISAEPGSDASTPAFWIPYQDIRTHNHMAQWTQQQGPGPSTDPPTCTCSTASGPCGPANPCGCCSGANLACTGTETCDTMACP